MNVVAWPLTFVAIARKLVRKFSVTIFQIIFEAPLVPCPFLFIDFNTKSFFDQVFKTGLFQWAAFTAFLLGSFFYDDFSCAHVVRRLWLNVNLLKILCRDCFRKIRLFYLFYHFGFNSASVCLVNGVRMFTRQYFKFWNQLLNQLEQDWTIIKLKDIS